MISTRSFGSTGIRVSILVFGSMRLDPARLTLQDATNLLSFLSEAGVTTWHSSFEYENHSFFCDALRRIKPRNPVHVMKLGEPHFDTPRFRPRRFVELVEQELRALGTDHIAIVQWLLRATPNEDSARLPLLLDCLDEVEDTALRLKQQGKIGALAVFPYSLGAAAVCLSRPSCAGLVSYLNPAEQEFIPFLSGMQKQGHGFLAIRPLCAGKLLDPRALEGKIFADICAIANIAPERRVDHALSWPLQRPAVSGVILSVSDINHARQAIDALEGVV